MKPYEKMSRQEASGALQEFLKERPHALEHLTRALGASPDGEVKLDGTIESLIPLWRWVKSVLTVRTTEATESAATTSPSWLRHSIGAEPTLSSESIALVDGVISYLCSVVERGAPQARWRVGHHRIKSYMWQNHPMLADGMEEIPLPFLVPGVARGQASGERPSADDKLALAAAAVIQSLNGGDEESLGEEEPLIEVEDLGEDAIRGRELELSLREDIGHEYSRQVDRMVKALAKENGIARVVREDREVLLVATSSWTIEQLEKWVLCYLEEKLHD